jgi:O-antigen/teichoic acid export membrane protein
MTTGKSIAYGQMRVVRRMVLLLGAIALWLIVDDVHRVGVPFLVLTQIAATSGSIIFCLAKCGYRWAKPDYTVRELLSAGFKAYPGRLSERLQSRIDIVLLGVLSSGAAVGVYTVATGIAEILFFISGSLSAVLFSRKIDQGVHNHLRSLRIMAPLGFAVAAVIGLAGVYLIPKLYGTAFSGAVTPLLCLLPGVVFMSLVHTISPYMVQSNQMHAISTGQTSGLVANVLLNITLIPPLGAMGAAISSTVSYGITLAIMLSFVIKTNGISILDVILVNNEDLKKVRAALQ